MLDLWSYLGRPFLRARTLATGPIPFPLPSLAEPSRAEPSRANIAKRDKSQRYFGSALASLFIFLYFIHLLIYRELLCGLQ